MKILFTILAIETKTELYLRSSKKLIIQLLNNTKHDILLSTNNIDYFNEIKNKRLFIRNNIPESSILLYGNIEFNYNLKYLSFQDIPNNYDVIFYIDGDISNTFWNNKSDEKIKSLTNEYEWIATRLNCVLRNEVDQYKKTGNALFKHKINSYEILNWNDNNILLDSCLPSEHFLIFKYNSKKIKLFYEKWKELNEYLQKKNGIGGCWGDGFEIGISSKFAEYDKKYDLPYNELEDFFGFVFNGNKT
jgi:hypothetical protein